MDQADQLRKIVTMFKENRLINEKSKNRIVTVTSGKGGVGKTMFTVNLALSLIDKGFRVLIIDADFGLSNINIALGIPVRYDLSHVLSKDKTIREIIVEGPNGLKFISGGNGIQELINIDSDSVEEYVQQLMELQDIADIILIDTGAGINDNILKFILSSSEVILITTPEPTALMDAYALTKTISKNDKEIDIKLVVNMAKTVEEAENTLNNFKNLANIYLDMKVEELGYLLFDKNVSEAIRQQIPFVTKFPKSDVSKNIYKIVTKFIDRPSEMLYKNNLKKFLSKFLTKKS